MDKIAYANSADPDQEQSDLRLHCAILLIITN